MSDEVLSSLFACKQNLANQKFELKINDIRFVSHPALLENKNSFILINIVFALQAQCSYSIGGCFKNISEVMKLNLKYCSEMLLRAQQTIGTRTSLRRASSKLFDERDEDYVEDPRRHNLRSQKREDLRHDCSEVITCSMSQDSLPRPVCDWSHQCRPERISHPLLLPSAKSLELQIFRKKNEEWAAIHRSGHNWSLHSVFEALSWISPSCRSLRIARLRSTKWCKDPPPTHRILQSFEKFAKHVERLWVDDWASLSDGWTSRLLGEGNNYLSPLWNKRLRHQPRRTNSCFFAACWTFRYKVSRNVFDWSHQWFQPSNLDWTFDYAFATSRKTRATCPDGLVDAPTSPSDAASHLRAVHAVLRETIQWHFRPFVRVHFATKVREPVAFKVA